MLRFLIFVINSIAALVLLGLLIMSYIPPSNIPVITSATLLTPVFLSINILFVFYWVLKLNKKALLSITTLLICTPFVFSFFQFNFGKDTPVNSINSIKILDFNSYNFSRAGYKGSFKEEFFKLVAEEKPDILFFQETNIKSFTELKSEYRYSSSTVTKGVGNGANPILSKYPIINHGSVGMDNVHIGRNTLFVDLKINNDTIRCYNAHLTSYRLTKKADELQEKGVRTIVTRLNKVFKHQELQVEKIIENIKGCPYPIIFCGDFNNMAFSYVYRELKSAANLKDTFKEKGTMFGATLDFKYFPTRIDYILVPKNANVLTHKVVKSKKWSDHYPIIATISFKND